MVDHIVRLLLVEDNPLHARLIQQLLGGDAQLRCAVESVDRLSEGLARLGRGAVDLVLLDLVLPDSQELETLFKVRAAAPGNQHGAPGQVEPLRERTVRAARWNAVQSEVPAYLGRQRGDSFTNRVHIL